MTEFCLNTNKYLFSFTIFIMTIMYFFPPQKFCSSIVLNFCCDDCNTQEKLKTILLQYFGGLQGVWCAVWKWWIWKQGHQDWLWKKRPKGYSKMERCFSRFTLEAALFPLGSLRTLGRRGGGIGFLVPCRKEDLVYTRSEYMCVVSKVLLSLNTG